ncbi:hypothetical protein AAFN47_00545 [Hoeflea sp. CAU 1731]
MKPIGKTVIALMATTFLSASVLPALASPGERGHGGHGWSQGFGGNWKHFSGRKAFREFDANGDGVVSQADVDAVMAEKFEAMSGDDGTVNLEQFKVYWSEQARPRMVRGFQRLDRDGDGQITREEFDSVSNAMFTLLDRDGSGELTRPAPGEGPRADNRPERPGPRAEGKPGRGGHDGPERKMGMRGEHGGKHHGGPRGHGGHGRMGGQLAMMEIMERFDVNGDGKITRAEFDEVRTATFNEAAGPDGSVDLEAFSGVWSTMTDRMMVKAFQKIDIDGNLEVTAEEFSAPTKDIVKRFDRNGDGVLTKADRKAGMDRRGHGPDKDGMNRKGHGPDKAGMERKGPPKPEKNDI